ncbi:MAG: DUF1989 domain-containing protein [Solirubrobacterales bacterium]
MADSSPISTTEIAPGSATRVELAAGQLLTVTSPGDGQGGDMSFIGFDQAMTRNSNGWEKFGRPWLVFSADEGMKLVDGDGEAAFEVGESRTDGRNDIMYPGCWREIYDDGRAGCRDLISEALGIERAQLTGMLSFFITSTADDDVYRGLGHCDVQPGDFVSFRALRDVVAAVSACPDDEISGWTPAPLEVSVAASGTG